MEKTVFISYSHLDINTAIAICDRLEAAGVGCWYAPRDIEAGEEWAASIMKALDSCSIMVLVFSDASNASTQVLREVSSAVSMHKTIIPYKITPSGPTGAMDYYLATLHWLDTIGLDEEEALDELSVRVGKIVSGNGETSEIASEKTDKAPKKKSRAAKLGNGVLGIVRAVVSSLISFFSLYVGFNVCGYKNSTAMVFLCIGAIALAAAVFRILRLLGKMKFKRLALVTFLTYTALSMVFLILGMVYDGSAPSFWEPDRLGTDAEMNIASYSYVALAEDGTVYYHFNERNGSMPSIRYCSLEEFLAGEEGKELVSGVFADNLLPYLDRYLIFRDTTSSRFKMKMVDLSNGKVTTLKSQSCFAFWTSHRSVLYGESTLASNGIGVLSEDRRYDGNIADIRIIGQLYYHDGRAYYINDKGYLADALTSKVLSTQIQNQFIIYDGYIYYTGTSGGIYRAGLDDPDAAEKLTDDSTISMVAYDGWLYYSNTRDNDTLYRVPLEGGEHEQIDTRSFNYLNIIKGCLYVTKDAVEYDRIVLDDLA